MTVSKSLPLVRAKLCRPPVGRSFVRRPRLDEELDRGLDGAFTLVCAPAGFGKSTLVSAWLDGLDAPLASAWLSLDERDGDITVFTRYLIAALRTIFPDACAETLELLDAPELAPLSHIVAALGNDIAALPSHFVLALDDYSAIASDAVHELLGELLKHSPPTMHLILIARRDPPLRLAGLRARNMLAEVRTPDLRFTREEIAAYLRRALPQRTDPALLDQFEQATEGWGAGLHLAALSLHAAETPDASLAVRLDGDAHIMTYLFDEVFSLQPAPIQAFLLRTAILDRYCASLAAAVMGSDNSDCDVPSCIEQIERADLFVVPLDSRKEWYRYHRLFQGLLLERLAAVCSPDQICELHARAANWFAARSLMDEALHHAFLACDLELAARLVERGVGDVLNREDPLTLQRWLQRFPEEFVQGRPALLMAKAWILQFSWRLAAQARILDQVEVLLDSGAAAPLTGAAGDELRTLRGQLVLQRGQQAYFSGRFARAIDGYEEALALLPPAWAYARGGAVLQRALSAWALDGDEAIMRRLLDDYQALDEKTDLYALRHLLAICFISAQAARFEHTRQTAQVMYEQAKRGGTALMRNWAHYFLGLVHLERNEMEDARHHFSEIVAHRHTTFMAVLHDGFSGLALAQQALGKPREAEQTLSLLSALDLERIGREDARTQSLRARLQLMRGDVEEAGRWANDFVEPVTVQPLLWIETPHMTRARVLITRGRASDLTAALALLDDLESLAEQTHNTRTRLDVLALRALALDTAGRPEAGLAALREATELARRGGFIRLFANLGPRMRAMLGRLARQGLAIEEIGTILSAFQAGESAGRSAVPAGLARTATTPLLELLTTRELEVLELLHQRLSDKEIARKLVIAPATVKRHTANIYGKLGVNRRADAVAQAELLGILPPR